MKYLILGAGGFVGKYLVKELSGATLRATCLPGEHPDFDGTDCVCEPLELLDFDALQTLLRTYAPDWIIHLAAQSSVGLSWTRPQLTVDINIKGTVNLFEAARFTEPKPSILLIGSGEEYGALTPDDCPIKETAPLRPANIYAATKASAEQFAQVYERAYGLKIIRVRAFNHIGAGQSPNFAVPDFCRQIAQMERGERKASLRTGNLSAKRDFTDVRDIVRAYRLLTLYGRPGEVYNVGSGHAVALSEIPENLRKLSKVPFTVETDPQKLRPSDIPIIEADITKIQTDTGWQPGIPLLQTLKDVLDEWRGKAGEEERR